MGTLEYVGLRAFCRAIGMLEARNTHTVGQRILARLKAGRGATVHVDEMVEILWGDDEDGGPESATRTIAVHIAHLRKAGHRIETWARVGWRYKGGDPVQTAPSPQLGRI